MTWGSWLLGTGTTGPHGPWGRQQEMVVSKYKISSMYTNGLWCHYGGKHFILIIKKICIYRVYIHFHISMTLWKTAVTPLHIGVTAVLHWAINIDSLPAATHIAGLMSVASMATVWSSSGWPQEAWPTAHGSSGIWMKSTAHDWMPAGQRRMWFNRKMWSSVLATRNRLATYKRRRLALWSHKLILYM